MKTFFNGDTRERKYNQTAVDWLVEQILTEVNAYDEDGEVNGIEYWNAFIGCTDLRKYVEKAKEMEKAEKINAQIEAVRAVDTYGLSHMLNHYEQQLKSE